MSLPLTFGDAVLFHSQVVHASPSQARHLDRFTVEVRATAGAVDDNSRVYRRLFWNVKNFQDPDRHMSPVARAEEFLETAFAKGVSFDRALEGSTAHAVVQRLFSEPFDCLDAASLKSPERALRAMNQLSEAQWSMLFARLLLLSPGDDLWFMLARISLLQGFSAMGRQIIGHILAQTESFVWSMQAARLAEEHRFDDLAARGFKNAQKLSRTSTFALDRFTPGMPNPRSPGLLQMLPEDAEKLSGWFLARLKAGTPLSPNPQYLDPFLLYSVEPPLRYGLSEKPVDRRSRMISRVRVKRLAQRLLGLLNWK